MAFNASPITMCDRIELSCSRNLDTNFITGPIDMSVEGTVPSFEELSRWRTAKRTAARLANLLQPGLVPEGDDKTRQMLKRNGYITLSSSGAYDPDEGTHVDEHFAARIDFEDHPNAELVLEAIVYLLDVAEHLLPNPQGDTPQ